MRRGTRRLRGTRHLSFSAAPRGGAAPGTPGAPALAAATARRDSALTLTNTRRAPGGQDYCLRIEMQRPRGRWTEKPGARMGRSMIHANCGVASVPPPGEVLRDQPTPPSERRTTAAQRRAAFNLPGSIGNIYTSQLHSWQGGAPGKQPRRERGELPPALPLNRARTTSTSDVPGWIQKSMVVDAQGASGRWLAAGVHGRMTGRRTHGACPSDV